MLALPARHQAQLNIHIPLYRPVLDAGIIFTGRHWQRRRRESIDPAARCVQGHRNPRPGYVATGGNPGHRPISLLNPGCKLPKPSP